MTSTPRTNLKASILVRVLARSGEARRRRQSTGIGLRRFAAALDVNASTLHRWETGQTNPTPEHAAQWLDLLTELTATNDASWNHILSGEDAEPAGVGSS